MKKLYFLFSFLFLTHVASAQKIRFTDRQNQWVVAEPNLVAPYYVPTFTSFDKDTILSGHTYVHSSWGWFREDTAAAIVYYRKELHQPERVLYNYKMAIGDSLIHPHDHNPDTVFYLHSVDSVMINGSYHRVQLFSPKKYPNYPSLSNTVIEGIGQIAQFPYLTYFHVDAYIPLSCFKQNGNPIYVPTLKNGYRIDSRSCTLGLSENPGLRTEVIIAPHPANSTSVISFPMEVTGQIRIINTVGQTVMSKDLKAIKGINLGALPAPGIYFYQITGESGFAASGRLMYE